jgi:crotonobetainyl-CoA:carnitine CoA-transferase CaiB-like acyl-CoA transferase
VSLAEQYPGPYATLLLADLGADVVLVERPDGGDPSRRFSEFFASLNRGKRSVALDLKDPAGAAACRALAASADVFIEGFRPGVTARLGLAPNTLCPANRGLVYVSISGFGQDGPHRNRPAHDLSYLALTGLLRPPEAGGPPEVPLLSLADLASGLFAAIAALTGLAARAASGQGGFYDVAMFDTLVSLLTSRLVPAVNGAPDEGLGSDPGYGVYLTADGRWLTLSIAFEDHFWRRLCQAIGHQALADISARERDARSPELRAVLADAIAVSPLSWWERVLTEADVPHGAVRELMELAGDEQVLARELLAVAGDGPRRFVRQPLVVDGERLGPTTGSPELGEHTEAVLSELGWSDARIATVMQPTA